MTSRAFPLSSEEEDTLHRSTKKIKEGHDPSPFASSVQNQNLSYKEKLVGHLPGAYESAFSLAGLTLEEADSDVEEDDLEEGTVAVALSKEEKSRIRSQWSNALIIKTFGRTVGYQFLSQRVRDLWKPNNRLDLVDLGEDFFLARFESIKDLDHVLKNGPWFIGQHFLAIKAWEPEFNATEANLSQVAIWIRLPRLPIEYYDPVILKKIGSKIGPVLRIDGHTATNSRGRFARLCVQVCLDKPLVKNILIGKFKQPVTYEGIHSLCFSCGRLGHKKEWCQYTIKEVPKTSSPEQQNVDNACSSNTQPQPSSHGTESPSMETPPSEEKTDAFGPWLLVSRKKPTAKKQPTPIGKSLQPPYHPVPAPTHQCPVSQSNPSPHKVNEPEPSASKGKRKLVTATRQFQKSTVISKQKPSISSKGPTARPITQNGKQTLRPKQTLPFSPNDRNSAGCFNPIFSFQAHVEPTTPLSQTTSSPTSSSSPDFCPQNALGYLAQEQGCGTGRLYDQQYTMGSTDDLRVDGQKSDGSLELHLPADGEKHNRRMPSSDRSGMVLHSQPMVEIHSRSSTSATHRTEDLQQLKDSLGERPLRSIARPYGERACAVGDMSEEILDRGVHRSSDAGHPSPTETDPNHGSNGELHHWHSDQTNSAEPPGTLCHSDAGNSCGQGGASTGGMEVDDFQEGFRS